MRIVPTPNRDDVPAISCRQEQSCRRPARRSDRCSRAATATHRPAADLCVALRLPALMAPDPPTQAEFVQDTCQDLSLLAVERGAGYLPEEASGGRRHGDARAGGSAEAPAAAD